MSVDRRAPFPLGPLLRALWRHAPAPVRRWLPLYYGLAFGSRVVGLCRPLALGYIFTVLERGADDPWPDLTRALLIYLGLELAFLGLHAPSRLLERRLAFRVRSAFFERAYRVLCARPLQWHRAHHSGDTIDRLRKAADGIYGFADEQFRWIQTLMGLVGPVVMLAGVAGPVTLIVIAANIAVLWGVSRFDRVIVGAMRTQNEAEHGFSRALFDYVAHMTTILSLRLTESTRSALIRAHDAAEPSLQKHVAANEAKYGSVSTALSVLEVSTLAAFVAWEQWTRGEVRVGMAVTVFRYLNVLGKTFYEAAHTYQDLLRKATFVGAAEPIFEGAPERDVASEPARVWERVELRGLRYQHPGADRPALDIDRLVLRSDERVALVGPSGAGKSTLLSVVRGLVRPTAGEILVDDAPLPAGADLGARLGVALVPQEPELFEDTLRFNVTGGLQHRPEQLQGALDDARVSPILERLSTGLDTDVRERGLNLSGGERQRIALARALHLGRDARMLLLDEATSSVDRDNEAEIYRRLAERYGGRAIIASVHGLHLLPRFDRVLRLEEGRLVEDDRPGAARDGAIDA